MTRSLKRPYTGSKAVSGSCRGRDGCPVCVGNRTAKHARQVVDSVPALVVEALIPPCECDSCPPGCLGEGKCEECGQIVEPGTFSFHAGAWCTFPEGEEIREEDLYP